ncbi:MAG TPA: diacylglycerol kinase family protein [Nakamurella sp.]
MIAVVERRGKVSGATRRGLREALTHAGLEPASWTKVSKARKATAAVAEMIRGGADTVVVCGGDGTVRAAAEALVDTGVALEVVPTGTANLFAAGLDLPAEPAAVVELVTSGHRLVLDTGRCNDRTFTVMAGAGLDAAMIDETDDASGPLGKDRLGVLSYVRAGLIHAHRPDPFEAEVTVDGTVFFDGMTTCVLVGNLGNLPGGLHAFSGASATDGLLDVAVTTAAGLRQWASLIISTARGRQEASPHARFAQGRRIVVKMSRKQRFELDGGTRAPVNG